MNDEKKIDILNEAITLGRLFGESGITWAFIGGVAVGIHGYIRATEDIDIIISPADFNRLDKLLKDQGFIIHKESIDFKDGFKLLRRVKIVKEEYFVLYVLIPPKEYNFLLENRIEGFLDEVKVYVISKEDLLWLKRQTGRKIDLADAEELERMND